MTTQDLTVLKLILYFLFMLSMLGTIFDIIFNQDACDANPDIKLSSKRSKPDECD